MAKSWFEINAKKYSNEALHVLSAKGLDLREFVRLHAPPSFRIIHTLSGEYFAFGTEDGNTKYSRPGYPGATCDTGTGQFEEPWAKKMSMFSDWVIQLRDYLKSLEEYASTPDLWEEIHSEGKFVRQMENPGLDNRPFTLDEQRHIGTQLRELKAYIIAAGKSQEAHAEEVSNRLRYLEDAATRLGRKDWLNILFSVLVAIVVSGVFAPDRSNELFGMAAALFHTLYNWSPQLSLP